MYQKEYTHCLRCNRRLKTAESMRRGYGSACAKKANHEPDLIDLLHKNLTEESERNGIRN